jgi:genome maintenance exonuclease 1
MKSLEVNPKVITKNGFRYYIINDVAYPSVTTILGEMLDSSWLDEWIERIGKEDADKISTQSANRGSVMHQFIEYYLTSTKSTKKERLKEAQIKIAEYSNKNNFTEKEQKIGRTLFYNFYWAGTFDKIKEVLHAEKALFCTLNGGYAGRVDKISKDLDDLLFITDFKSSKKPKDKKKIIGYYLQIAAYYVAYFQMTGVQPSYGEVWISNEFDNEPQVFHLSKKDIKKLTKLWLKLVANFHKKYPSLKN